MLAGYSALYFALAVLLLLQHFIRKWKRPLNLPPGPSYFEFGLKMLRGWIEKANPFDIFSSLAKKYGPIFMTSLDPFDLVILNDFEHINEVLTHEHWVNRTYNDWMTQRTCGKHLGLFFIGGEVHREMRKFCIRTLRECGFGKSDVQEMSSHIEIKEMIDMILTKTSKTNGILEIHGTFVIPILNILWVIITGSRLEYDDCAKMQEIIDVLFTGLQDFPLCGPHAMTFHLIFPRLAKFLSYFSDHVKGVEFFRKHNVVYKAVRELLEERRALGEYKYSRRTYIDAFLQEIDLNNNGKGSVHFTDDQFVAVTFDLFAAGADTSNGTMEFAILYMILHPEIQSKVQEEIDNVIGQNRYPVAADKAKMPFTVATILEIHRSATLLPLSGRSPTRDTRIGKYFIPKNSLGLVNMFAMHMDENVWKNPHEFNPYRFLDSENNVINAGKILPFGAGKRVCFGESVANATIFTFFTSLLQRFTFEVSPEHPKPTMKHRLGFTLSSHPFHTLVKDRLQDDSRPAQRSAESIS